MNDAAVAISIVEAGSAVVREYFGTRLERYDKDDPGKGAGDFATTADIEAEKAMLRVLRRERPHDSVLGEESGRLGGDASRIWLIDPLCGTLNYAARMKVAAVNAALQAPSGFLAAAVADPFSDELYWTDSDRACMRSGGSDERLAPSATSTLVDLNFDPPFPNGDSFKAATLCADPEFAAKFRPRVVSTSLALAWVATGQRAAYVTDGDVRDSVHFAAGIALCEAAGGVVTDLRGNHWGSGPTGLVASADATTHEGLLALIRKYIRSR